jgi:hypothetical protein
VPTRDRRLALAAYNTSENATSRKGGAEGFVFSPHTSMVACDHAAKKAQLSHLPWRNWLVRSTVSCEFAVEERAEDEGVCGARQKGAKRSSPGQA